MRPKVSIVIPVYNSALYLRECLDSLLSQTCTDWECILVDDGSKDASGAICDEYASVDNRFRVFHKENGGVSSARNHGIDNMRGEWVIFVDSDDDLPQDAIGNLLSSANRNDCDMAFGNYVRKNTDNTQYSSNTYQEQRLLSIEECLILFFNYPAGHFQGYLWNRLMRTSIIVDNSVRFNETIYYKEDGLFLVNYLLLSNRYVTFVPEVVYNYNLRSTGAMQSASGKYNYKYLTNLDARLEIYNLIKSSLLCNRIIDYARNSVYVVVRIILKRRPRNLVDLLNLLNYITKRLYKSRMLGYVLKKMLKSIVVKYF